MAPPHPTLAGDALAAARAALQRIDPSDPEDTVRCLRAARDALDAALNEAMANAALTGSSIRSVADMAGLAPNSVAPRLARTASLSGYVDADGRVTAAGVQRARYDHQEGREPSVPAEPLRFRRRVNRK